MPGAMALGPARHRCSSALVAAAPASAAIGNNIRRPGDRDRRRRHVEPEQVVDGIYVVNGHARILGRVDGDVVVVDGDPCCTGRIDGNLVMVAGRAHLLPGIQRRRRPHLRRRGSPDRPHRAGSKARSEGDLVGRRRPLLDRRRLHPLAGDRRSPRDPRDPPPGYRAARRRLRSSSRPRTDSGPRSGSESRSDRGADRDRRRRDHRDRPAALDRPRPRDAALCRDRLCDGGLGARPGHGPTAPGRILAFLAGLAILRLLALVPAIGLLVGLGAVIVGLGLIGAAIGAARDPAVARYPRQLSTGSRG